MSSLLANNKIEKVKVLLAEDDTF
jgi:CheY-like chemotaxis protein